MNNNHTRKLIELKSLDNTQTKCKLQNLSSEEISSIQGGLSFHPSSDFVHTLYYDSDPRPNDAPIIKCGLDPDYGNPTIDVLADNSNLIPLVQVKI